MSQSIWWHLAMTYHVDPYPGHRAFSKAKDCHECQQIARIHAAVSSTGNPTTEGKTDAH